MASGSAGRASSAGEGLGFFEQRAVEREISDACRQCAAARRARARARRARLLLSAKIVGKLAECMNEVFLTGAGARER